MAGASRREADVRPIQEQLLTPASVQPPNSAPRRSPAGWPHPPFLRKTKWN